MGIIATVADFGPGGSAGPNVRMRLGSLQALASGLRRMLERFEDTSAERQQAPEPRYAADTRIVNATGDLRDTRVLQAFHRRCEEALNPGRRRVRVDLADVASADTKLVATLLVLWRRAKAVGVPVELTVSSRVYEWISLCQVQGSLQPACVQYGCNAPHTSGGTRRGARGARRGPPSAAERGT